MTAVPNETKLYKYHTENLKSLDAALCHIALTTKNSIRQKQEKQIIIFNRMYALTLGAWAEVRLLKLLYDNGGFSQEKNAFLALLLMMTPLILILL